MTEIRTITDDEVVAYSRAMATGFGLHMTDAEIELRRGTIDVDRTHAAFEEDGSVVGTARSFPTELTVPGGSVRAGAVTNVTVMPTHRRRGVLTGMMQAQLDDIAARDEPVAILIASESTIYGRFGYGPATWNVTLEVETARGRFADVAGDHTDLRMVDRDEIRRAAPALYERFRPEQPAAIGRTDWAWDIRFGVVETGFNKAAQTAFHVLHPDGWLSYGIEDRWEDRHPASTLNVLELVALTPEAYAALWRHAIAHDLIAKVVADDRPEQEPLSWLLADPRRVRQRARSDFLWVRVLDVPAALSARTYGDEDRLVLEVVDEFVPSSSGCYRLDTGEGTCSATTGDPDLTVSAAALGAAYLGGTPLWPAAATGRVQEHTKGALARADRLFAIQPPPWCHTWF
jgi:predicted acetyltransferase